MEIVKPGGTGRPAEVISARPAPLPPRVNLRSPSVPATDMPSALPLPKKKTRFAPAEAADLGEDFLATVMYLRRAPTGRKIPGAGFKTTTKAFNSKGQV